MIRSILAASLLLCGAANAVNTFFIEHSSEEDFKKGKAENVLIHSDGSLTLSHKHNLVYEGDINDWVVNDIAADSQGNVYAGTSGQGQVYKVSPANDVTPLWNNNEETKHVFSVAIAQDDSLLVGTGGENAALYKYNGKKFKSIWSDDSVKFIWDIAISSSGKAYIATGPEGKIFSISTNGKNAKLIYDSPMANILTLALNDNGELFAGTDEHGLIYKIDLSDNSAMVIYDTGKKEVSSIAIGSDGDIYAATSEGQSARPGAKLILSKDNESRSTEQESDGDDKKMSEPAEESKKAPATRQKPRTRPTGKPRNGNGNNVFKISPEGFAEIIFAGPVVIYDLEIDNISNSMYLATGIEGCLIKVDLETEKSVVVYDSESSQISALVSANDKLYAGCAGKAAIEYIEKTLIDEGVFTSDVFDARQPSLWGTMYVSGSGLNDNARIQVRVGNTSDPENGGWSQWYDTEITSPSVKFDVPVSRYLQYKAILRPEAVLTNAKCSFSLPNLKPVIEELVLERPQGNKDMPLEEFKKIQINWQADDVNKDKLIFDILIKEQGSKSWIKIADNIEENQYLWDTNIAPDGYYTVKVIASDELSNPTDSQLTGYKISELILVDNTAPEITDFSIESTNDDSFAVNLTVNDKICVIKSVEYSMDSDLNFRSASTIDNLADSNIETFQFILTPVNNGLHFVTVIVTDIIGNRRIIAHEFNN